MLWVPLCLLLAVQPVKGSTVSPVDPSQPSFEDATFAKDRVPPWLVERHGAAGPRIAGDTYAEAIDMVSLPFHASGQLWDFVDDYDFGYGTSPDVVYQFTPDHDGCVKVDGCASDYDQMIFVVDEALTIVARNDDGRACDGTQSQIAWMPVCAGVLYYYVIDGYGGARGPYDLVVDFLDCPPPPVCPPGAILEGEPHCYDGYVDHYNGGCNSIPPIFMEVPCSSETIIYCGEIGNFYDDTGRPRRDTDWYALRPWEEMHVHVSAYAESSAQLYIWPIMPPCSIAPCAGVWSGPREWLHLDWFIYSSPDQFYAIVFSKNYYDPTWYSCDGYWPYILMIDGYTCEPSPAEGPSWGAVKALFRDEEPPRGE